MSMHHYVYLCFHTRQPSPHRLSSGLPFILSGDYLHPDLFVSHAQISSPVNRHDPNGLTSNGIYCTMNRLRRKMRNAISCDYIETVRNMRYRLKQVEY